MWMMGCNDGGEICLPTNSDSLSSDRKLRPLIPRPPPNPNSLNHHHHHHHGRGVHDPNNSFFALNHHHLAMTAEQSKRELNAAHQVVVSSRWNPTPEQLQALEDLYRRGTRTPSADQIQQITSQLRRYGKIEGKNVFYWFQNHKARERQKRRRQMESCGRAEEENSHLNNHRETGNLECKESDTGGTRKTGSDDVQRANSNNTAININCSNNDNSNNSYNWGSAEGSNIDRGGRSAMAAGRGGRGGGSASATSSAAAAVKTTSTSLASSTAVVTSLWMKLNDTTRELHLPNPNIIITTNTINVDDNFDFGRNATCPSHVPPPPPPPVLLPASAAANHTVRTASRLSSPPLPFPSQDLQTLQLFPLQSEDCYDEGYEKEMDRVNFASACCVGEDDHLRRQFFEFLPLKN